MMAADRDNVTAPVTDQAGQTGPPPAASRETAPAKVSNTSHVSGQQHPIGMYLKVWGCLFVLSAMSYFVDYFQVEGLLRWMLILTFMFLKAGLIIAVFMHMAWERLALVYAILVPPICLGTLVLLMAIESDYTFWTRTIFFGKGL